MLAALALPTLPDERIGTATVHPPLPGATSRGGQLRRSLPAVLVEALEKVNDQIDADIMDPLLGAASGDDLARIFEEVFPKFRDYYLSTVLITWAYLKEDAEQFSALTIRSFQESEDLVRARGPRWMGDEASLNALQGLSAMIRIAKAARKVGDPQDLNARVDESHAAAWTNWVIAYALAFSAVLAALGALERGEAATVRLDNVAALAHWSRRYAVQAYHLTKTIGLLKTPRPDTPLRQIEEEDVLLSEAGLEAFAEGLWQEDRQ